MTSAGRRATPWASALPPASSTTGTPASAAYVANVANVSGGSASGTPPHSTAPLAPSISAR